MADGLLSLLHYTLYFLPTLDESDVQLGHGSCFMLLAYPVPPGRSLYLLDGLTVTC
jgi:hypothetical protein